MSEDLIEQLAEAIGKHIRPAIPLSIALWNIETVADFLQRDMTSVRQRFICRPDFPAAIRLPSASGNKAHPLYKATEVIAFAEKYREKK